jgi:hypothetical protein
VLFPKNNVIRTIYTQENGPKISHILQAGQRSSVRGIVGLELSIQTEAGAVRRGQNLVLVSMNLMIANYKDQLTTS